MQVRGQGACPHSFPQAGDLVKFKLSLEVDEQPPEAEEVVEAVTGLQEGMQLRVKNLQGKEGNSRMFYMGQTTTGRRKATWGLAGTLKNKQNDAIIVDQTRQGKRIP